MEKNENVTIWMCLGIIFVVLGHKGGINLFTEWFPYYSFHMPFFIFLAGYLFKEKYVLTIKEYILKKFKHLMLPYYKWNLFYGLLATALLSIGFVKFMSPLSLYNYFLMPFVNGHQFGLNVAAWFVPQLFAVQVIYIFFARLVSSTEIKYKQYIGLIILLAIGILGVWLVNHKFIHNHFDVFLFRTMFFMPFFHMGWMYKNMWEEKDRLASVWYFLIIFAIQYFLIKHYKNITFVAIGSNYPPKVILPFITSITGIAFWLRIGRLLTPVMIKSNIVKYIGDNTWTVMMHHQFIFFLINIAIYFSLPFTHIKRFNIVTFKENMWYACGPWQFLLFYSIAGIAIPLLVQWFYETKLKKESN